MISDGAQYIKMTIWGAEVGKNIIVTVHQMSLNKFSGEKNITTRKERKFKIYHT